MNSIFKIGMRDPFKALLDDIGVTSLPWTYSWSSTQAQQNSPEWSRADDGSLRIEIQLPGIPREAIELYVENGTLTLVADGTHEKSRSSHSRVERRWTLLDGHDSENITAELLNGILTLTVPTLQVKKPERKAIKVK